LRQQSARFLRSLDFPGYAIGGLSVGETKPQMYAALAATTPELPADRPRYLMGVGAPEDILESVALGVDIFDCVLPTRVARNGGLLTHQGRLNIRNARFRDDPEPIEPGCTCQACRKFSRAYVSHLFRAGEILGMRLATLHNLHFMMRFMEQIRAAIAAGRFQRFKAQFLAGYRAADQDARFAHKKVRSNGHRE
jgi:queuine tRNA-ribosyltransferase